jgi:hypothetical protein
MGLLAAFLINLVFIQTASTISSIRSHIGKSKNSTSFLVSVSHSAGYNLEVAQISIFVTSSFKCERLDADDAYWTFLLITNLLLRICTQYVEAAGDSLTTMAVSKSVTVIYACCLFNFQFLSLILNCHVALVVVHFAREETWMSCYELLHNVVNNIVESSKLTMGRSSEMTRIQLTLLKSVRWWHDTENGIIENFIWNF